MLEITRTVWDGNDCVPHVWERWLHESNGALLVAVQDGQVVGLQHAALQPDGSAWLEGIRVAEAARGQGVGEVLVKRGVAWARDMGCPVAQLAVSAGNAASNQLSQRAGFQVAGRFRTVRAEALSQQVEAPVRLAQPFEEDEVLTRLEAAGCRNPTTYTEGWTAYRLTRDRLRLLLATHAVAIAENSGGAIAIVTAASGRPSLRLGLAAGDPSAIESIGRWLRTQAFRTGVPAVRGTLNVSGEVMTALERAGFRRGEEEMLLRELRLS